MVLQKNTTKAVTGLAFGQHFGQPGKLQPQTLETSVTLLTFAGEPNGENVRVTFQQRERAPIRSPRAGSSKLSSVTILRLSSPPQHGGVGPLLRRSSLAKEAWRSLFPENRRSGVVRGLGPPPMVVKGPVSPCFLGGFGAISFGRSWTKEGRKQRAKVALVNRDGRTADLSTPSFRIFDTLVPKRLHAGLLQESSRRESSIARSPPAGSGEEPMRKRMRGNLKGWFSTEKRVSTTATLRVMENRGGGKHGWTSGATC